MEHIILSGFSDEIAPELDLQLAAIREWGLSHIELRAADGVNVSDFSTEKGKEVNNKLAGAGVSVSSIGSPIGKIGVEEDFAPHLEKLKRTLEIQKELGAPYLRMFSFYIPQGRAPEDFREEVLDRVGRMAEEAAAWDSVLLHENEKGIYGDTLKRVEKLHKAIPALRCVFDPANYIQCGDDPAVNFKALAPIIDYMHIKDALFKDGSVVPAGEGDGSVPSILKMLAETGKPYMLTLEPHLYDFSGLQNLQGEDVLHKRVYKDADEAFDVASDALHDILKTIE